MAFVSERLKKLENPIRIAIIGIGSAGKGIFYQSTITPGIDCVGISDIDITKAISCAEEMNKAYRIVNDIESIHDTIKKGFIAVCEDGNLLSACEIIDIIVDSSTAIAESGQYALTALEHNKHVVMMNTEADLIFGPYLMNLAHRYGVVYTSCDGDQPGVISRLIDDIQLWGFDLVMAGNIKGFLDRYSNPTKIIPEADKRNLDYKMCTSYTDGTKLCIEMALVANAFDLSTSVPGMYGHEASHVLDVFDLFDFRAIWNEQQPVVDYILGAEPHGGVFVVGYCDNEYQRSMLSWFPSYLGKGPFYLFYHPYHLVHIEAMACIAEAFLDSHSLLQPVHGFRTNVYAYAKDNLSKGSVLDGIGGYKCYGLIENCAGEDSNSGLPICLANNVTIKRDIVKDTKIYLNDIQYHTHRLDYKLYSKAREQSDKVRS